MSCQADSTPAQSRQQVDGVSFRASVTAQLLCRRTCDSMCQTHGARDKAIFAVTNGMGGKAKYRSPSHTTGGLLVPPSVSVASRLPHHAATSKAVAPKDTAK